METVLCSKGGQYISGKKKHNKRHKPRITSMAPSGDTVRDRTMESTHAPLTAEFDKEVRPYIDLIDDLRQFGLEQDVKLPAVAVIGDQSSGKSSTLEAISGIQLPRGSGIVTRCPLNLILKSNVAEGEWRARIRYKDSLGEHVDKHLEGPDEVEEAIRRAQERIAGDDKGISDELITLEVQSRNVPDLTLIDLPGITRVATLGQSSDVPQQIKQLIRDQIQSEETIILGVVPANVDIATTEALQMAQEFDPSGERTLGVVTKPDLIDRGTENELKAIINNEVFPLQKGYTVVKCRAQKDITEGQTLEDALRTEEEFFKNTPHFNDVDKTLCGVKNLSHKLTEELVTQIKRHLPRLKDEVSKKIERTQAHLDKLGQSIPDDATQKRLFFVKLLNKFCEQVVRVCSGQYTGDNEPEHRLYTKSRGLFKELLEGIARETPMSSYDREQQFLGKIMTAIEEQRGDELPRFMNYKVCQGLIREIINKFSKHAGHCLTRVDDLLNRIISDIMEDTFVQFPRLLREVKGRVNKLQQTAKKESKTRIDEIIEMEKMIFTQDRIFSHDLDIEMEKNHKEDDEPSSQLVKSKEKRSEAEELHRLKQLAKGHQLANVKTAAEGEASVKLQEAKDMYTMIKTYLEVSTRRMVDHIPLTIMFHLIKRLSENIHFHILAMIGEQESIELVEESPRVAKRREELESKLQRLELADGKLSNF